jgi:hypothetical protein
MTDKKLSKPTHQGSLKIGDKIIPCAVLPDKTRVLSERAIAAALGLKRGGSHWIRKRENEGGADLPVYLSSPWLQPFISEELKAALNDRRKYLGFGGEVNGLKALDFPEVLNAYLRARDSGKLNERQAEVARQADMLIRGFAKVGIIALVDEATGYQEEREKDELRTLFGEILRKEAGDYYSKFQDDFFDMLYKIYKLKRNPIHKNRHPQFFGKFIRKYVYAPLDQVFTENKVKTSGVVLDVLDERNPVVYKNGGRKYTFHQFIEGVTLEKFKDHLKELKTIGKIVPNSRKFDEVFARVFKIGTQQGDLFEE